MATASDERIARLQNTLAGARERARKEAAGAVRTLTMGVSGFALGAAEAQWGSSWWGADPALATAVATGIASFWMPDEMSGSVVRAVADGSFGIWTYKTGFRMNIERVRRARAAAGALGTGAGGSGGGTVAEEIRQAA